MNSTGLTWGKKMIRISVYFWTNNLPKNVDNKTAWENGVISLTANSGRGLSSDRIPFTSLDDFFPKLKTLLEKNKVKLIRPSERYVMVDLGKLGPKHLTE